mmetsp:Transcript_10465/g.27285  ORF Transcript_10465/g.27285 Transcript_10465/m.27285 type:complete len:106 (-) Transcript_10465:29-346(-)
MLTLGSAPKLDSSPDSLCHSPFFLNPLSPGTQPHKQFGLVLFPRQEPTHAGAGEPSKASLSFCSAGSDPVSNLTTSSRSFCPPSALATLRLGGILHCYTIFNLSE